MNLQGFAACAIYDLRAIFDLLPFSSILPPLDVVVSLGMKLDFAAHADLLRSLPFGSTTAG